MSRVVPVCGDRVVVNTPRFDGETGIVTEFLGSVPPFAYTVRLGNSEYVFLGNEITVVHREASLFYNAIG